MIDWNKLHKSLILNKLRTKWLNLSLPTHVRVRRETLESSSAYLQSSISRLRLVRRRIARLNILNATETISALHAKVAYILKIFIFNLCHFGIVPFRHIKVKNFGPYMPNWHSSPYRLTQSRILAIILKIYRLKRKVPRSRILVL